MNKENILVCFMSCKKNNNLWDKLLNYDLNSIIFYGEPDLDKQFIFEDNILKLKCGDTYDHLPSKVYLMIKSILEIQKFKNIEYIFKIDDHDTKIDNNFYNKINKIKLSDYYGQYCHFEKKGNRKWHFNKCPTDSIWYNKIYKGEYASWVDGGCGYFLSRKAMKSIINENLTINDIYQNHIYEDLMIGIILKKNNILPKQIKEIIKGDKNKLNV